MSCIEDRVGEDTRAGGSAPDEVSSVPESKDQPQSSVPASTGDSGAQQQPTDDAEGSSSSTIHGPSGGEPGEGESSSSSGESGASSGDSAESASSGVSGTSGISSVQQSDMSPGSPVGRRSVEKYKCSLHPHSRYRRNTCHVACQTDYTDDFPSPITSKESVAETASSSSEGVLRLMIQNFRSMADTVRGPSKRIQGICWRIMVMPRQHVVQKKGTQKCLGFFLQCCPNPYSDNWSCQAQAELRLISQKQGVPHFTRKTNHNYTPKENDWGYSCFMTWADILDESQGYIKDDRVILEVTVKADTPKNILTHEDFIRTVQNWIELANMQYNRGLIDLAIEANAQALKFCKDKDAETKQKLEDQKKFFIEQKLVQSIVRIEKGVDDPKPEDELQSQSALRQALTASNTKHAQGKNVKGKKNRKQATTRSYSPPTPPTPPPAAVKTEVQVKDKPKTEKAATVKNPATPTKTTQPQKTTKEVTPPREQKLLEAKDSTIAEIAKIQRTDIKEIVKSKGVLAGRFNTDLLRHIPLHKYANSEFEFEPEYMCASLARTLEESLNKLQMGDISHERDLFIVKYMNEQYNLYKELGFDPDKRGYETERNIKTLAENAFDLELQRQLTIKKAAIQAVKFQEEIDSKNKDSKPVISEECKTSEKVTATSSKSEDKPVDVDLSLLFDDEKKKNARLGIVDRESKYLDAKIRLYWNEEVESSYDWTDDLCYSERESVASSDSDRQYDGSIKPKRTKLDPQNCSNEDCACHSNPHLHDPAYQLLVQAAKECSIKDNDSYQRLLESLSPMVMDVCEIGVQTEAVVGTATSTPPAPVVKELPKNTTITPSGRLVKKATSKKKTVETPKAKPDIDTVVVAQSPIPDELPVLPVQQVDKTVPTEALAALSVIEKSPTEKMPLLSVLRLPSFNTSGGLPMELAMKFPLEPKMKVESCKLGLTINLTKVMEEFLRGSLMQRISGPTKRAGSVEYHMPPLNINFDGVLTEKEIMAAINGIALDYFNTRNIILKVDELLAYVTDSTSGKKMRRLVGQLATIAGMTHVADCDDVPAKPSALKPITEYTDADLNEVCKLILTQEGYIETMFAKLLGKIDDIKADLGRFDFIDDEDFRRMKQATQMIEGNLKKSCDLKKESDKKADAAESNWKKLEKQNKTDIATLKSQMMTEKERNSTLQKDIREKTKEIKKLETKVHSVSTERDEAQDKAKQLQKDAQATQKKFNEEVSRLKKDLSAANDTKKHMQAELGTRDAEVKGLSQQIEDKAQLIKKAKHDLDQEKQKNSSITQSLQLANERAKKAELTQLQLELDIGIGKLETAKSLAQKQIKEMDGAVSARARSQIDVSAFLANRDEWKNLVDQIESDIAKANEQYKQYKELVQSGKSLAALPKISVSEPPTSTPSVLKVPPIVSVEPTKPTPGVIGSRPQGYVGAIGNNSSPKNKNISPQQKSLSPESPVRHPGAIGTRPNGAPVNGASTNNAPTQSDAPSTSANTGFNWIFDGMNDLNIANDVIAGNSDLLILQNGPRVDHNGWDEQNNTWTNGNAVPVANMMVPGGRNSGLARPGLWQHQHHPPPAGMQPHMPPAEDRHHRDNAYHHRNYWMHFIQSAQKKGLDPHKAFAIGSQYLQENNLSIYGTHPEELVELIRQPKMADIRLPPSAAPGFLANPLAPTFIERAPIAPPGAPPSGPMSNGNSSHTSQAENNSGQPSSFGLFTSPQLGVGDLNTLRNPLKW